MQTISINSFNDLQQFGINPLTGEACKYGQRTLCDLNEKGCELVASFLGLVHNEVSRPFAANWNSTVNGEPAVASIMLTRGTMRDLSVFALLNVARCYAAIDTGDASLRGVDEQHCRLYRELPSAGNFRFYVNPTPGTGDRNQHAFTGRTV